MGPNDHQDAAELHHTSDETFVVGINPGEEPITETILVPVIVDELRGLRHDVENGHDQSEEREEGSRDGQDGMVFVELDWELHVYVLNESVNLSGGCQFVNS
mmetsp:Transcript_18975/g.31461  ORF Transcript_18975/g.31461 Transcript_18975/m.31461 type:complete len:102 (+) Transcript_18975:469-774(+)